MIKKVLLAGLLITTSACAYNHKLINMDVMENNSGRITAITNELNSSNQQGFIYGSFSGSGNTDRKALSHDFLLSSDRLTLMDYSHYSIPKAAANPTNNFQGRLSLHGENKNGKAIEVSKFNNKQYYRNANHLPEFDFEFIQHGTHLIPIQRGLIASSHGNSEYILEPGRVWNEAGDLGYSRAALPFSLQETNANCTWNGVLTFLFKDDGSISNAAYQFAGETCFYMKLNLRGKLEASYTPHLIKKRAETIAKYEQEVANRIPTQPIKNLINSYPQVQLKSYNSQAGIGADADEISIYGVLYKGIHYVGDCKTRFGLYPFCEVLNVPSYSTAKSVAGGYGLMRLEKLYPGSKNLLISDYVPECSGDKWQGVTFKNALDMSTGNYISTQLGEDEALKYKLNNFFEASTHKQLIDFACGHFPHKSKPGEVFSYHTSDTYVLGRAMHNFYQQKTNSSKDFYNDIIVDGIWKPLNLSPTTYTSKRSYDESAQIFTGYGLTFVRDDIPKLAQLLANKGSIAGKRLLDAEMITNTLHLPPTAGLDILNAEDSAWRYNNGFWYEDLAYTDTLDCTKGSWVPYMAGYGGITIAALPNGMIYYHFGDANHKQTGWINAAMELNKISPLCQH
ncbi:serine hydrolase [Dasania marina]|uniref:serine hydrolase n=1 Tax=Dasania marina TaxID=471499 RepID=UPI000364E459|nr:serine hydrolase [Dasania marina]